MPLGTFTDPETDGDGSAIAIFKRIRTFLSKLAYDATDKLRTAVYVNTGSAWEAQRTPSVFKAFSLTAVGSETTVWTPAAGKKFRLMGMMLAMGTAVGAITWRDGTGGTTIFVYPQHSLNAAGPVALLGNGILSGAADRVLTAQGVATETITGTVWGTEE